LKAFIERFSKVALKIKNLNPEVILQYMMVALKVGPFTKNLSIKPLTSMYELR